jgi:hypothetical protein
LSGELFAALTGSIEVYPFESHRFIISGGQIVSINVRTTLRDSNALFDIQLAPGGPYGTESPITWDQIITPMSHILIGMSRGNEAAIVLDGVVTRTGQTQAWRTSSEGVSSAGRGLALTGSDFNYFYRSFNYYALTFFGLSAGVPGSEVIPLELQSTLSKGQLGGGFSSKDSSPVQVGQAWYNSVMAGQGLLGKTYVPYTGGNRISFTQAMAAIWENYPNVFIPYSDFFMANDEAWLEKFQGIFPFPWYEFFVTTAPDGFYTPKGATAIPGTTFSMASIPRAEPAGPVMVARINPAPFFDVTGGGGSFSAGPLDVSRWNALPLFDFTQRAYGFFQSNVVFSGDSARNFYQLNPTGYSTILNSNASNTPLPFLFIAAADPASVQRYGFRPQLGTIRWMFDPQGLAAQNSEVSVQTTMLALTGKMISWYHPVPLMASAEVTLPLIPTLKIGTRFRFAPFKALDPWDFYIEAVEHHFEFGGGNQSSWTRLSLSRGLPSGVYADAGGILQALHVGNAQRADAIYYVGLPNGSDEALTIISTQDQASELSGHLAQVYATPQRGAS